jgi:hypothetical protein
MAYIIKNTSGLINTRLTDIGRRYLSQGNFNISYFQIGDSEVNYKAVPNHNQTNNNILMPAFNAHNDTGAPESNKQHVKYPYYLSGSGGTTYGIPYMDSQVQSVYNAAGSKGFFSTGRTCIEYIITNNLSSNSTFNYIDCETNVPITNSLPPNTSTPVFCSSTYPITEPKVIVETLESCGLNYDPTIQTTSDYTITSNYWVDMSTLAGQTDINIELDPIICSPTTGTPSVGDFITIVFDGDGGCGLFGTNQFLTYKIQEVNGSLLTLDRATPNYSSLPSATYYARTYIYPSGMTVLYDFITPAPFWETDTLNFESPCDVSNRENTLIWNMNIPWSESPAGVFSSLYEDYTQYGSVNYIGTKEYLGYQENSGQTFWTSVNQLSAITDTFYYNSFDEKISVEPKDQKAIAIIHYTNQDIDNVYGEKFATIPFDPQNPTDNIGLARHFKVYIPNLMWHKSIDGSMGQVFWVDPPGYDLCKPYYMKSSKNIDMNDPGLRYFHLWDSNPDSNSNLNRIGKVFPDQQIIVIDDDEVVASLSYKSNRNWTLPAPKVSLISPNVCQIGSPEIGILTSDQQTMWITYRFDTDQGVISSLHCNYYTKIVGPSSACTDSSQNVVVRFGAEFPFMSTVPNDLTGFTANSFKIIFQIVEGNQRPNPSNWREYDFTDSISLVDGYITQDKIGEVSFIITQEVIDNSDEYELQNYIDIPQLGSPDILNFGDEYYFYGNIETDITATIYEMKYLINLGNNQFTNTSNPTWSGGTKSYFTEVGLYNSQKELMVISKLQSPELRQGIQQVVVKLDF